MFWLAQYIGCALPMKQQRLLWIRDWGIWPSSEDWNLFARLRRSYGEERDLAQAPGHLFSRAEAEDLDTFLHLCLISGWDAELVTDWDAGQASISISHDEWLVIRAADAGLVDSISADLAAGGLRKLEVGKR